MKARRKWGNSSAVRIPAPVRATRLQLDESADVREEAGRIVIEPLRKKIFELEELARQIAPKNLHVAIDTGPAAGNEVW